MEPLPFEIPYERMAVAARATVGDKRLIVYCAVLPWLSVTSHAPGVVRPGEDSVAAFTRVLGEQVRDLTELQQRFGELVVWADVVTAGAEIRLDVRRVEDGLLLNYLKNGRAIRVRRLRVPKGVLLHHQDVPKGDRVELGAVPVTSVLRTLTDCADVHVSPELIEAAVRQARERGFIDNGDARRIRARSRAA